MSNEELDRHDGRDPWWRTFARQSSGVAEGVNLVAGWIVGRAVSQGHLTCRMGATLVTAATHNTTTSRHVPLVAQLSSGLSTMSAARRLTLRRQLLHLHGRLRGIQAEFDGVLRQADSKQLAWIGTQADLRLSTSGLSTCLSGADLADVAPGDELGLIERQLLYARHALYHTTTGQHRWRYTNPFGYEWQIVIHHLANVYGRRAGGAPSALENLEHLANDFAGADLRHAALPEEERQFDARLTGVRWDDDTRWPAERLTQVERASIPLTAGVREIQPDHGREADG